MSHNQYSSRNKQDAIHEGQALTRRSFLKKTAIGTAAVVATASAGPFVRTSKAAALELTVLGWEPYHLPKIVKAFEAEYGVKVSLNPFDANADAHELLRAPGGLEKYDVAMADGFWPRKYAAEGLIQPVDYTRLSNLKYVFPDFKPPNFQLFQEEQGTNMIAAPNNWGGYGITENSDKIAEEDSGSIALLFNEQYKGHLSTNIRLEENIALTGILVCHQLGTKSNRPDGKPFNPYVLTKQELEEVKKLLIQQKGLLLTRWTEPDTLERLFRSQLVWASPEWSSVYGKIHSDHLDGKTDLNVRHILNPKEGGLGWVDCWMITAGVKESEKLDAAHKWIDFRLKPENMAIIATDAGFSPSVDVRTLIPERYVDTLFLNNTAAMNDLYQFDAPSDPEAWEKLWAEVENA